MQHHLPLLHKTKSKTVTLRFTYPLSASQNYSPTACSEGLLLNETDLKHSRLNKVRYRHELSEMAQVGNTCSQATVTYLEFQTGPFHIHFSCVTDRALPHTFLLRYRYTICWVRTLSFIFIVTLCMLSSHSTNQCTYIKFTH